MSETGALYAIHSSRRRRAIGKRVEDAAAPKPLDVYGNPSVVALMAAGFNPRGEAGKTAFPARTPLAPSSLTSS
jgi:hypothetical protein